MLAHNSSTSAILNAISSARQALTLDSVEVYKGESGPSTSDSKLVRDKLRRPGFYIAILSARNPADRKPALSGPQRTVPDMSGHLKPVPDRDNSLIESPAPADKPLARSSTRRLSHIQEASMSTLNAVKRRAQDDIAPKESKKTKLTLEEVEAVIQNSTLEIDTVMAHIVFLARATKADQVDGIKNRVPIPTSY